MTLMWQSLARAARQYTTYCPSAKTIVCNSMRADSVRVLCLHNSCRFFAHLDEGLQATPALSSGLGRRERRRRDAAPRLHALHLRSGRADI